MLNPVCVIIRYIPDSTLVSNFTLRVSDHLDPNLRHDAQRQDEFEHEPSVRWASLLSYLFAVRLNSSVHVNNNQLKHWCLFVVSVHAPADCSSLGAKDEFQQDFSRLLRALCLTRVVIGNMSAQIGYLGEAERYTPGQFSVPADRTDTGNRCLHFIPTTYCF